MTRIAARASKRRWEVLFVTQRPATAGDAAQTQTQRWLRDRGFPLPAVYVVRRSRGAIAEALGLDAVVDDQVANCLDVVADSRARPLLLCREGVTSASAVPAGPAVARPAPVTLVRSIDECLEVLETLEVFVTGANEAGGVGGSTATGRGAAATTLARRGAVLRRGMVR